MLDRARRDLAGGWAAPVAALALGALQSQAFAPRGWWPLGSLCAAGLWWLWVRQTPRRALLSGFAFGFGLFAAGTYWTYTAVHGFGKVPVALGLLLSGALVSIMAAFYAALGWACARARTGSAVADALLLMPAGWVLTEWLRGWVLTGFPWLALGYAQIDSPLVGYAPVFGVYGAGLAAALVAGGLLLLAGTSWRAGTLALGVVFLGGYGLGLLRFVHPAGEPVSVAIIQGSISQDEKWQADNRLPTRRLYRDMTQSAFGSRIIVWPETAIPELYHEIVPYLADIDAGARERGSDLVLGVLRYDPSTEQIRNGLLALGDDEQWYYKRHLVPFGEYFPVPAFVRSWMRLRNLAYVDLSPGPEHQGVLRAGGLKLGATICYEDSYGAEQLGVIGDADALVNVSNDAWYGDSSAPHEHLEITRMRAVEAGRYMIRATNNGISALIDPEGAVVARSRQFVPEVLRGEVTPYAGLTPYARTGNAPTLLLCVLSLAGVAVLRRSARSA